ncbi:MAG: hypothetical protein FJZ00_02515 [Candidatus Sericytochromatia bacterium]|uniref:DoxX family protein n=1 Tax=Candidatus Tanganyikabacteria bacterium TaxID=2961651 RepID=A0A937X118_9BACT|nr:hypothetical protein [Candidatus Tanganyikabacteria bacterium]
MAWLAVPEAVLGVMLVLGLLTRIAAVAMLACFALSFALFPGGDAVDLIVVPGLAIYLLAFGRGRLALDNLFHGSHVLSLAAAARALDHLGLPALRVLAGIELVVLGLNEKLLYPQFGLHFLEERPWLNFMAGLGFAFPNDLFVLCAGLVEVGVGVLLLAGIFPRLLVVVVAILFSITFTTIGVPEQYGHLAYVGAAVVIFIQGGGRYDLPGWIRTQLGQRVPRELPAAPRPAS